MRPKVFLAVALSLLVAAAFLLRRPPAPHSHDENSVAAQQKTPGSTISPILSASATGKVSPATATSPAAAQTLTPMPPNELARIVAENSAPGRMVFVDLAFSSSGITATHAIGAAGRAKPPALQHGVGQLQYEVYSPAGERTLTGSIEDPLHARLEYEDPEQPGKLRSTVIDHPDGPLQLRLPGEADAARVVFYRETNTGREPAGEITFR